MISMKNEIIGQLINIQYGKGQSQKRNQTTPPHVQSEWQKACQEKCVRVSEKSRS